MSRLFWLIAALAAAPLNAQAPAPAEDTTNIYARKSLRAARLAGSAPTIDGRLDDAVWQSAAAGTDFVQLQPNPGRPATQKTEIRFAYDNDAIYVAARMYDTRPDSVVAQLARRDSEVYSDWVYVCLDSYYDRRTAFAFGVNPKGVKVDVLLYDDTNEMKAGMQSGRPKRARTRWAGPPSSGSRCHNCASAQSKRMRASKAFGE